MCLGDICQILNNCVYNYNKKFMPWLEIILSKSVINQIMYKFNDKSICIFLHLFKVQKHFLATYICLLICKE